MKYLIKEGNFEDAMKNIKAINKQIDKAIKEKDKRKLDQLSSDLGKILNSQFPKNEMYKINILRNVIAEFVIDESIEVNEFAAAATKIAKAIFKSKTAQEIIKVAIDKAKEIAIDKASEYATDKLDQLADTGKSPEQKAKIRELIIKAKEIAIDKAREVAKDKKEKASSNHKKKIELIKKK
ncbi:MAG: hypothetical protein KAI79_20470 [Bacteroidales bacterium]|nr:hypothetical protein [Bacteroidales bacterium]